MKKLIPLAFVLLPSLSGAVKFHCYSLPNMPVQVYEYASPECLASKNPADKAVKAKLGDNDKTSDDGMKSILCTYQAVCANVDDNSPAEPVEKPADVLTDQIRTGHLKGSILICRGRGAVDANGVISDANCPSPSRCQKDVLYNFGARSFSPSVPIPVGVDTGGR